jgi:hypothetical protein
MSQDPTPSVAPGQPIDAVAAIVMSSKPSAVPKPITARRMSPS